jgi:hypothetical protein
MDENKYSRFGLALRVVLGLAVVVAVGAGLMNQVASQEKGAGPAKAEPPAASQPSDEEEAQAMEIMKMSQELATPGENHKVLDSLVGNWNLSIRSWMGGPDAPATESKGTSEAHWVLGGRYIVENLKCEYMMPDPETGKERPTSFEGIGTIGYDNYKNLYVYTWIDNMGTAMLVSRGGCDPLGKVLSLYGEMDEPEIGVQGRMVKYVTRIVTQDKRVFEMYDLLAGDDHKMMEITYTRKK